MIVMGIESLLPFLKEADRLKSVTRQTLVHSGERVENSAEHAWHLALAVLIFRKVAPENLDVNKAIKMALLHDIVEIDAGDVFVYDDPGSKEAKESLAIERLSSLLPAETAAEVSGIWREFEMGESNEAKYVSALDRFLPLYSNYLNKGYSWKNHGITSDRVIAKNHPPIEQGLAPLWEIAKKMIDESVAEGHLSR